MAIIWKQLGPSPYPITKIKTGESLTPAFDTMNPLYLEKTNYTDFYGDIHSHLVHSNAMLEDGREIIISDVVSCHPDLTLSVRLFSKAFTILAEQQNRDTGDIISSSIKLATLGAVTYEAIILGIVRCNNSQFLIFYQYETSTVPAVSAIYCRLISVDAYVSEGTTLPVIALKQSSALTLGGTSTFAANTAYTKDTYELLPVIEGNNGNIQELLIKRRYQKYTKAGLCSSDTLYFNGMYLNGVSAVTLLSTAWTSLVTCNPSAGLQSISMDNIAGQPEKYGFGYSKTIINASGDVTGFTGGFVHRINGSRGTMKNVIMENLAVFTARVKLSSNRYLTRSSFIGQLNQGELISITETAKDSNSYVFNIWMFNPSSATFMITNQVTGLSYNNNAIYIYLNNNLIGEFIDNQCNLYQIIRESIYDDNYIAYAIGSLDVEKGANEHWNGPNNVIGSFGNNFYNIGEEL